MHRKSFNVHLISLDEIHILCHTH